MLCTCIRSWRSAPGAWSGWGRRHCSSLSSDSSAARDTQIRVLEKWYAKDEWTNVTAKICGFAERRLHLQQHHPLNLLKSRIVHYFYERYRNQRGNPLFSVYDRLSPVVTLNQNFDSLLVPADHVSRKKSDSYYLNKEYMLRAHTSAHQSDLINSGLDNFLVVGDVYRRDEIDAHHFPVFHQVEGVRLFNPHELAISAAGLQVFDQTGQRSSCKQASHSLDAARLIEADLKQCLVALTQHLFGPDVDYRWVDCYFPFTHPSWELEIWHNGQWLEILGCGVMEQQILNKAGAEHKIGWAFGLGLERLAMRLYQIPDIRLFWSDHPGFLCQFLDKSPDDVIIFKEVSKFPACANDISFWLPNPSDGHHDDPSFSSNDFYDMVRSVAGEVVEQVTLMDVFQHPKTKLTSHCYRIVYRDMCRTLTQKEVNVLHEAIRARAVSQFKVQLR